ncbi:hypothetical protein V7793_05065 [Streptomyces sp. KLMMK]|uniref:hypothetical protein n=1 Tax=Streptomyces sp. KLMMK TaxID=3109353 RepID=UPI002FFDA5BE
MMETTLKYQRGDVDVQVIFDDGTLSPIYLGVHTPDESFEVNIDRQDIGAIHRMLLAATQSNINF